MNLQYNQRHRALNKIQQKSFILLDGDTLWVSAVHYTQELVD